MVEKFRVFFSQVNLSKWWWMRWGHILCHSFFRAFPPFTFLFISSWALVLLFDCASTTAITTMLKMERIELPSCTCEPVFQSQQDGPDTIGTTNFLQKIVSNISGSEVREDQGIYFPVHRFGKGVIVFNIFYWMPVSLSSPSQTRFDLFCLTISGVSITRLASGELLLPKFE